MNLKSLLILIGRERKMKMIDRIHISYSPKGQTCQVIYTEKEPLSGDEWI